ncbi:hypothetical protein PENFLA_c001G09150 [Penicillium flavigenum]|uniref:Uncharacterized protein n=1 Tax=Penicillium flavigenum TaxID=254877 RepID=A0A1V6U2X2_9EURO|nr:hypothetical protein PENFLA_c001G09150 [Penicillium flavigenum]
MLQFLHPYGVIAVPSDIGNQYAMVAAVRRGDSLTTEYFLNQGFDPNSELDALRQYYFYDHNIRPYLGIAAEARDPEAAAATLDVLLHYGADIDKLEEPPCCWSKALGVGGKDRQLVSLRLLLERGANPLPEHKFGLSMLAEAAERNHKEAIQLLLTHAEKRALTSMIYIAIFSWLKKYQSNGRASVFREVGISLGSGDDFIGERCILYRRDGYVPQISLCILAESINK